MYETKKPKKIAEFSICETGKLILSEKDKTVYVTIVTEFINKDNEWDTVSLTMSLYDFEQAYKFTQKKFSEISMIKEPEIKEPENLDLFIATMEEQIKWDIKTYALYGDLKPNKDGLVSMRYSNQAFKETIRQVAEKCNIDPIELGQYLDEIGYDEIQLFDEGFKDVHISFDPTYLDFIVEVEADKLKTEEKEEGENNE